METIGTVSGTYGKFETGLTVSGSSVLTSASSLAGGGTLTAINSQGGPTITIQGGGTNTVDSVANVITVTSPQYVPIADVSTANQVVVTSGSNNISYSLSTVVITPGSLRTTTTLDTKVLTISGSLTSPFVFTAASGTTTPGVVITSLGRVGIGTTAPTALLHVVGITRLQGPITGNSTLTIASGITNSIGLFKVADPNDYSLQLYDSDTASDYVERIHINRNSGNIGFGTSAPGEKLSVEGTISGSGNLAISGSSTLTSLRVNNLTQNRGKTEFWAGVSGISANSGSVPIQLTASGSGNRPGIEFLSTALEPMIKGPSLGAGNPQTLVKLTSGFWNNLVIDINSTTVGELNYIDSQGTSVKYYFVPGSYIQQTGSANAPYFGIGASGTVDILKIFGHASVAGITVAGKIIATGGITASGVPVKTSMSGTVDSENQFVSGKPYGPDTISLDTYAFFKYKVTDIIVKPRSGTLSGTITKNAVDVIGLNNKIFTSSATPIQPTSDLHLNYGDALALNISGTTTASGIQIAWRRSRNE